MPALQKTLNPFEKAFNLPAPPVEHGDPCRRQGLRGQIRDQHQRALPAFNPDDSYPHALKLALAQAAPGLSDDSLFAVGRTHLNGCQHRDGRFLRQTEHVGAPLLGEPAKELVVLAKVTIPHISRSALPLLLPTFTLADPTNRHLRQGRLILQDIEIEM